MSQENYYLILEIDPSEKDLNKIRLAIDKMQSKWSKERNHPTKGRLAQNNLSLLGDIRRIMLEEIVLRDEMATAAKKIQADSKKKALQDLDETLEIFVPDGFIKEIQVKNIIDKFKGKFSEKEVRARILLKISITDNITPEKTKLYIDKGMYKEICDRLNFLKLSNLYDFLGLSKELKHTLLADKAKNFSDEIQKVNNKTADITAKQELIGHCLNLFKTQEGKEKYDNSFEAAKLDELNELIELSCAGGSVSTKVMEGLISKATAKGISPNDARSHIVNFLSKLNLKNCSSCGHSNEKEERACSKCGKPLYIDCPKCSNLNDQKNQVCSKCGFSLTSVPEVLGLLNDADIAISRGDCNSGISILKKAEVFWPDFPDIKKRYAEITRVKKEQEQTQANIDAEISAGRCFKAFELLICLKQSFPGLSFSLDSEVRLKKTIENAKTNFHAGQLLLNSGKTEEGYECFSAALSSCKDYKDAQQASALCYPAPPTKFSVIHTPRGIILNWVSTTAKGEISYEISRKTGLESATLNPDHTIGKTSGLTFTDNQMIPGEIYYYSVYSRRDASISRTPVTIGPIIFISNATDLKVIPGNKTVTLEWELPQKAISVEVWRDDKSAPKKRGEGKLLSSVTLKSAIDSKLINGQQYGYLVVVVYSGLDGKPIYSEGGSILTTPNELPKPVSHLTITRQGSEVDISWEATVNTGVQVYNCINKPKYKMGELLSISDLNKLGSRIPSLGPYSARGKIDLNNLLHLLPVSLAGPIVVAGKCTTLNWFDDVDELKIALTENELFATWKWPQKSESVLIAFRQDAFPEAHDDAKSKKINYPRYKYERNGGFRGKIPSFKPFYISVFAIIKQGDEEYHSSGYSPGARKFFPLGQCCSIKYRISNINKWFMPTKEYLLKITPSIKTTLPSLILVAKSGGIPLDQKNGTTILTIPEGTTCSPESPFQYSFKPEDDLSDKWRVRLFPLNDEFSNWLEIEEE